MNEKSLSNRHERAQSPRLPYKLIGLGVIALSLAGTTESTSIIDKMHHAGVTMRESAIERGFIDTPGNQCFWDYDDSERKRDRKAANCQTQMESDTIAYVDFDNDPRSKTYASALSRDINRTTGGLVNNPIDSVPASDAAKKRLDQLTPDGCIPSDNRLVAAIAADEAMPKQLKDYDKILTSSAIPACPDLHIAGTADWFVGRHASLIGIDLKRTVKSKLGVGGHELLHLYGRGHFDDIFPDVWQENKEITATPWNWSTAADYQSPTSITDYLSQGIYQEYAPKPIENVRNGTTRKLNIAERLLLGWQKHDIKDTGDIVVHDLNKSGPITLPTMGYVEPTALTYSFNQAQTIQISEMVDNNPDKRKQRDIQVIEIIMTNEYEEESAGPAFSTYAITTSHNVIDLHKQRLESAIDGAELTTEFGNVKFTLAISDTDGGQVTVSATDTANK